MVSYITKVIGERVGEDVGNISLEFYINDINRLSGEKFMNYTEKENKEKEFTLEDLKKGNYIVETAGGNFYLTIGNRLLRQSGWLGISDYTEDFIARSGDYYSIVKVVKIDRLNNLSDKELERVAKVGKVVWKGKNSISIREAEELLAECGVDVIIRP